MSEVILQITDNCNIKFRTGNSEESIGGYIVTTTQNEYIIGITNDVLCCENFGYLSTPDDISEFINSELLTVEITDSDCYKKTAMFDRDMYENTFFIDFVTTNGTFQLMVYNTHNGYYGHNVYVLKNNNLLLQSLIWKKW